MPLQNINAEKIQGNLSITSVSATTYYNLPTSGGSFTGGTVSGPTTFTNGLTANTISATTYYNLPTDIYTTGGTYNNNTFTFTNNTGGTFSTLFNTLTGVTVNGDVLISGSSLPNGFALSVTGDTNFTGDVYVSGDITYNGDLLVTGGTIIQSGLTANTIYTDYIDFNTNYTGQTLPAGRLQWDDGNGTLVLGLKGGIANMEIGLENMALCYNDEATTLTAGTIVYVSGSQGNRPSIKRAIATGDGYSVTTLGVVSESIASGAEGFVTTFGMVNNLNTIGLSGGTPIWLSPTVSGGYTDIKPQAPYHTVLLGYAVRIHASVGSIFVHISNGWEIDELHDVRLNGRTQGDLLTYSGYNGSNVWVNSKTLNGSYTITGNTTVGGGLTASTISASTIYATDLTVTGGTQSLFSGNSSSDLVRITQTGSGNALVVEDGNNPDSSPFVIDASGNVGMGTNTPLSVLHIKSNPSSTNTATIRLDSAVAGANSSIAYYSDNVFRWEVGTGIALSTDYEIYDRVAGKTRLSLTTSGAMGLLNGDVGIGTSTPQANLHVTGSTLINGSLTASTIYATDLTVTGGTQSLFSGNSSSDLVRITQTGSGNALVVEDETNPDSSPFIVNASGFVGVGTYNPLSKFVVSNNNSEGIEMGYAAGLTSNYLESFNRNTGYGVDMTYYISNTGAHRFYTNGTERVRIDNNGNVGIGTTNPNNLLDIQKSTGTGNQIVGRFLAGTNTNGSAGGITLGSTQTQTGYIYGEQTASSSGDLVFGVQNLGSYAERMRILANGNVGIGTTTPVNTLDVSGSSRITGGLTASTISATTYYNLPNDIYVTGGTYSNGTTTFTNNSGGTFSVSGFSTTGANVGSGTTIFSGTSGSTLIFKSLTSTASTVTFKNNTNTVNLETNVGVAVVPIALSSVAIGTGSNDYYLNFKTPHSMIIASITFSVSTAGSDNVKLAIYRGQDTTATLVGQSAAASVSTINTFTITAESGQNLEFKAGEWMVIGVAVGGTTTNLYGMACPSNNLIAWTNTTDSTGGFPTNPRSKAGTRTSFPSIEINVV